MDLFPCMEKICIRKKGEFNTGNILKDQSIKIKNAEENISYRAIRRANNKRGMNTQITASYIPKSDFIFKLRRKWDIYTPVVYFNRLKSIKIDNEIFNKFIVRTNDKNALDSIFQDDQLINLIGSQDIFCIEIRKGKKINEKILYIEIDGIVDNYEGMEDSFSLTTKIIKKILLTKSILQCLDCWGFRRKY